MCPFLNDLSFSLMLYTSFLGQRYPGCGAAQGARHDERIARLDARIKELENVGTKVLQKMDDIHVE